MSLDIVLNLNSVESEIEVCVIVVYVKHSHNQMTINKKLGNQQKLQTCNCKRLTN